MTRNWKPLLIVAIILTAAWYLYPSTQFYGMSEAEKKTMQQNSPARLDDLHKHSINLGLDLQGGIHLVMEVDLAKLPPEEAADAVARTREVIRNRIDQFGVAEPTIQQQGENRIIIELPGVQDVERAKGLIGQTARLEFKLLPPNEERERLLTRINAVLSKGETADSTAEAAEEEVEKEEEGLFEETEEGIFEEKEEAAEKAASLYGERDSMLFPIRGGGDIGIPIRDLPRVKFLLQDPRALALIGDDMEFLFSSKPEGTPGNQYYILFLLYKKWEMTGDVVQDARVSMGQDIQYMGQPIVNFETTDEGVELFRRITGRHVGERLGIVLDNAVYSAPEIISRIPDGRSIITGSGTREEAQDLAIILRAGALPTNVTIIEDRTVGPSLGRDSIEQGKSAALISMMLIAIFMIIYYRFSGLIANVALGLNIVFVMAVLSGFHATLTLPGIAGIILTIGMAVDANVLIFERIREELRRGKTVRAAIDSGYSNALSAIIDANVTTFLVGIVLYEFGTGPIRGFALTLCIGILSSLFTAFFVSRTIFDLITRQTRSQTLSIGPVALLSNLKIAFLSMRKLGLLISAGVLLLGVVSVVGINGINPGIDFVGGTLLELHFDPPVKIENLRNAMNKLDLSSAEIKEFGSPNDILIRVTESNTELRVSDGIKGVIKAEFGGNIKDELEWLRREEQVGPNIGEELSEAAVRAVLVALVLILIYMAWRFHRFLYGIAAVSALFHDVLITLGLLSLLDVEITLAVVAALLAIVGYSLNDTIVVFDRIRENLNTRRQGEFADILNLSINDCLSRTLVTSLTTLMAVLALMIWGGEVIRSFTITLLIGVVVGTYSSIFIATPVLYYGQERADRKEKKK
jgi:SecD/SecF fusion protein